jgi:hypothetical protein
LVVKLLLWCHITDVGDVGQEKNSIAGQGTELPGSPRLPPIVTGFPLCIGE